MSRQLIGTSTVSLFAQAKKNLVVVLRFLAEVADARAAGEPGGAERSRRAVALRIKLAVADVAILADDRDLIGLPRGVERHGAGDGLKFGIVHVRSSIGAHVQRFCSSQ